MGGRAVSASERRKGGNGEREVVKLLHEYGWPKAKRTSDGTRQATRGDIAGGPLETHFEVRRRERIEIWSCLARAEAEAKPGHLPVLAFRRNRSRWYAALPLESLLELLAGYEE
jgi:Holliday junction resolvase